MSKFFLLADDDCSIEEGMTYVVHSMNDLTKEGRHSPFEHVSGRCPAEDNNPLALVDGGTGMLREQRRLWAKEAFLSTLSSRTGERELCLPAVVSLRLGRQVMDATIGDAEKGSS